MDFYPGGGGGQGGPMTDIRMGDGWPSNISGGAYIIENLLHVPVFVTCGFLNQHSLGAEIVRQTTSSARARTVNGSVVVAEQISSVLMLPRNGLQRICGNTALDSLNERHMHLHVSSVQHALGNYNAGARYHQVQRATRCLFILLSDELPDGLRDSVEDFLHIWGNTDNVRTGDLRTRLSALEGQLASTYDDYTVDDDIVQFLTGEQSPVYTLPPNQEGTTIPTPLPQAAPVISADVPAWLESETHSSSGTSNSSISSGSPRIRPGRLYLRVVFSIDDDDGNPIHIYPMFKHGKFKPNTENSRLGSGYTDLPPRDSQNNRLVSRFCAVSGAFPDGINSERRFSNRLHEADFPVESGIGGQSEWHRLLGDTNQERYVGLLNAIEVLENFSDENGVQFERRNILDRLELHFNEE